MISSTSSPSSPSSLSSLPLHSDSTFSSPTPSSSRKRSLLFRNNNNGTSMNGNDNINNNGTLVGSPTSGHGHINYKWKPYISICFFLSIIAALQTTMLINTTASNYNPNNIVTERIIAEDDRKTGNIDAPQKPLPFNKTNPHQSSWCPQATCHNSPLCAPCNRRYLFIISSGRSGSTTLLKMFDSLPSVRLSGENLNQLYLAYNLVNNVQEDNHFRNDIWVKKGRYEKPIIDGPFQHNALPLGGMSCAVQELMNVLNPPQLPIADQVDVELVANHGRISHEDWVKYGHHDHVDGHGQTDGKTDNSPKSHDGSSGTSPEKLEGVTAEDLSESRDVRDNGDDADIDANIAHIETHNDRRDDSRTIMEKSSSSSSSPLTPSANYFQQFHELIERDSKTIFGMKVIRIQRADWKPSHAAKFLKAHFPCSRFLINIRSNITQLVESYHSNFHWNVTDDDMVNKTNYLRLLHYWLNDDGEGDENENVDEDVRDLGENNNDNDYNKDNNNDVKSSETDEEEESDKSEGSVDLDERLLNHLYEQDIREIRAKMIDFSRWKDDISVLNDVVDWLGFEGCSFNVIPHENQRGYEQDKTTMLNLGEKCHYPHI